MDIVIGSDHAGFDMKEECKSFLAGSGEYTLMDMGVYNRDSSDYPRIAQQVARTVAAGEYQRGILICGSGIGMSIAANRFRGIRAALCHNLYLARMSRLHNDANILVLGGRVIGGALAMEIVDVFLKTECEGGRHKARLDMIDD
jgi:ribose 5-phosphate isomerase B